jgi:outer membrane immunogenic protein
MRSALVLVLLLGTAAVPQAKAQVTPAAMELYGGYDYVLFRVNANVAGQPPFQTFNANGGGGQLVYNVNNWLGVLGNLEGYWATNSRAQGAAMPYLLGPRINFRRHKVTPFAQVLLGGVVTSSGIQTSGWQNNFAMTAGGGFDIRLSEHLTIRPMQAEYFLTKIPDGANNRQNNFRYSAGISLLLGKRS